jgi:hypothetical protein
MARSRFVLLVSSALLLASFARPAWTTAAAGACDGWSVVASPNDGDSGTRLFAVDAASANDIWAVGDSQHGPDVRGLTEHWDGTAWTIVPNFYTGNGGELHGVAALASDDVWAVGFTMAKGYYKSFAEHWNGVTWTRVGIPSKLGVHNYLTSVTAVAADDVWAVGYTVAIHASTQKTLVEHWDGTAWSIVPSPNPGRNVLYNQLLSVDAFGPDDVWAVGFYDGPGQVENLPLVEQWDGTAWSILPVPAAGANNILYSVAAVGASDVWAVGEAFAINPGSTLVEHWDGAAWSIVPSPSLGSSSVLQGVTAISSGDVWALGGKADVGIFPTDTLAEHWDGSVWSIVATDPMPDSNEYFNGAAAISSTDVWGVGVFQPLNDLTLTENYCQ